MIEDGWYDVVDNEAEKSWSEQVKEAMASAGQGYGGLLYNSKPSRKRVLILFGRVAAGLTINCGQYWPLPVGEPPHVDPGVTWTRLP